MGTSEHGPPLASLVTVSFLVVWPSGPGADEMAPSYGYGMEMVCVAAYRDPAQESLETRGMCRKKKTPSRHICR